MKGLGTDEATLVKIIGALPRHEMAKVRDEFNAKFNRDLIKDLKSETSGHFQDALVALATDAAEFDAQLVRKAVKGIGTNEDLLNEVLCTRYPFEIEAMAAAYKKLFGRNMLNDVEDDTSGDLQKVYNLLITDKRSAGTVDESKVEEHVQELYKAGEGRIGTNEGVFIRHIAGNPREYVEKLYWKYAEKHGKALDLVISKEFSGPVKKALMTLCTPLDMYFARKLHESMKGVGTNDDDLVRLVCTQKERALKPAAARFLMDYKKTLKAWVADETSGDYKKILVTVLDNFAVADGH